LSLKAEFVFLFYGKNEIGEIMMMGIYYFRVATKNELPVSCSGNSSTFLFNPRATTALQVVLPVALDFNVDINSFFVAKL
jgi:hypothetical protein